MPARSTGTPCGRELAALAGLGTLSHLDLDVVGVGQIVAGHPEPTRGHLLDRTATVRVVEPLRHLAALARVGLRADHVHGDGQGLVRLLEMEP